ncbi:MAG: helix-turn-helix transcriptional regulator [Eubacteriales bacterium]|nr:helix-turn-helix transcriptional regulator [Eubacteriales bacterium]
MKELRKEANLSQDQLGKKLGFSNQTVSFWESGKREPSLDALVSVAKYFDVSVDFLLGIETF